jgi:hypothetical protein
MQPCTGQLRSARAPALHPGVVLARRPMLRRRRAPLVTRAGSSLNGSQPLALVKEDTEVRYLGQRSGHITRHFKSAIGVDDFTTRVEQALFPHGFKNDNSIGRLSAAASPHMHLKLGELGAHPRGCLGGCGSASFSSRSYFAPQCFRLST